MTSNGGGISSIPDDVLASMIFVRLPARSLLAIRFVCKSWFSLTTSPRFVLGHARRRRQLCGGMDVAFESKTRTTASYHHVSLDDDDESAAAAAARPLDLPSKLLEHVGRDPHRLSLSASCDGLLCFDHWGKQPNGRWPIRRTRTGYVVVNPLTEDWLEVLARSSTSGGDDFVVAFYFHSSTGEYRLLQQYSEARAGHGYEVSGIGGGTTTAAWRPIRDAPFPPPSLDRSQISSAPALHGSIHFLQSERHHYDRVSAFVVAFDTDTEKFRKMSLPPGLHLEIYNNSLIVMGGGNTTNTLGFTQTRPRDEMVDMWCLKDYNNDREWTKQYAFSLREHYGIYPPPFLKVVWEDGKEVLLNYNGFFLAYNFESKTFKEVYDLPRRQRERVRWVPHVETLVSCNSSFKDVVVMY